MSLALGYLLGQIPILDAMPVARSDAGAAVKEANAKQAAMDAGEDVEVDTEQPAARSRRSQTISRSKVQKMVRAPPLPVRARTHPHPLTLAPRCTVFHV